MVSIYDEKVKGREATLRRMKKLGDQVVTICRSIVAKLQRHKLKGSSNQRSKFMFTCWFCDEKSPLVDAFHIKGCNHFYCTPCIVTFVVSKLRDDITSIQCPHTGCYTGVLDLEYCRSKLPTDVTDRWKKALSLTDNSNVNTGLPYEKYLNCPFKDCAARLTLDELQDYLKKKNLKAQLLPEFYQGNRCSKYLCCSCDREICFKCRVPYHTEFDCCLYQKIKVKGGGEDMMAMYLATMYRWKRCPCCKNYVMRKDSSCDYVICWCGYEFCYNCLRKWKTYHDERKCEPFVDPRRWDFVLKNKV